MMRNFGTPGLTNKEFGFKALYYGSFTRTDTDSEKDVSGLGGECVGSARWYRSV